jgi:hypothetical protein
MKNRIQVLRMPVPGCDTPYSWTVLLNGKPIRSTFEKPSDADVKAAVQRALHPEPSQPFVLKRGFTVRSAGRPRKGLKRIDLMELPTEIDDEIYS